MSYPNASTAAALLSILSAQSSSQKRETSQLPKCAAPTSPTIAQTTDEGESDDGPPPRAQPYYRREHASPERGWTIIACDDCGAFLGEHHFHPITIGEHPDPDMRAVSWPPELFDKCAFCDHGLTRAEIERCTCQRIARECPVHGRGVRR